PGAMGLLVAQCAAALGAGRVIVVGHGQRLDKARDLGFLVVDFDEGDPVQQVKELSEGKGAHLSLECAGTALAIRQAVEMVRKGGRVVFNGLPLESVELPMQKIVLEEIDLYGVRANQNTMEEVIPLMLRGAVSARSVITHVLPLRQFREAYDIFVARREGALKVVVKPQMGG
ncbi:MAG: zinc-binding dehydrogenase, partial [Dehalococcoidia bacterium]